MARPPKCIGWISFSCLLLLPACSKDEPTAPIIPETGYLAVVTIGPQGGTLASQEFILGIPQGAFSAATELRLKGGPGNSGFGINAATRQFSVEGLPESLLKPLSISLHHTASLSGRSFIAVGQTAVLPGTDSTSIAYHFLPVRDSAGMMMSEMPFLSKPMYGKLAASRSANGNSSDEWLNLFVGITDYDTTFHGRYFMYSPATIDPDLRLGILLALNATEQTIKGLGLPFYEETADIEAIVRTLPLRPGACAQYHPVWYRNWQRPFTGEANHGASAVLFSEEKMRSADRVNICAQAGRELFYVVPELAYARLSNPVAYLNPDHYWLHTALASWMETYLMAQSHVDPNYIPTEFPGNERKAMDGILAGAATGEKEVSLRDGFGKSALIKFLTEKYRESVVWRIYDELKKSSHPVDAVRNSLADPPTFWWTEFVRAYVGGSVYSVSAATFLANTSGSFPIGSKSDTLATFDASYRDLSAKLYYVDLNYPGIENGATLRFTVQKEGQLSSSALVLLFGLTNGVLEYWTEGVDVNVKKTRDLTVAGQDILAAVVNSSCDFPYNAFSDINLKVRVMTSPVFQRAAIQVRTRCSTEYSDGTTTTNGVFLFNTGIGRFFDGVYNDGVFTATWDIPPRKGSLTIKGDFTAGISTVTYFDVTETLTESDIDTWRVTSIRPATMIGGKMSWGSYEFTANGAAACEQIATVMNRHDAPGYWSQLMGFSCDGASYVKIVLE
jgi:hypothetical protein